MQIVIAALLAVYFLFFVQHAFNEKFFSRVGQFQPTAYDLLFVLFLGILAAYFVIRSHTHKSERLHKTTIFWTVNVFAFLTCASIFSHLYDDEEKSPAVAVAVGYLATVGWLYTNYMNLRNAQRAHTMNVLMQLRTNAVLNEHRINYLRKFPVGKRLTTKDLPELKAELKDPKAYNITSSNRAMPVADSIRYMANLYEFICVGMRQGDLDEVIIRKSLRSVLLNFHDQIEPWIDEARQEQKSTHGFMTAYENYIYYVKRFRAPS